MAAQKIAMAKPILILKMGDTLLHLSRRRADFEDWIMAPLENTHLGFKVVATVSRNPPTRSY